MGLRGNYMLTCVVFTLCGPQSMPDSSSKSQPKGEESLLTTEKKGVWRMCSELLEAHILYFKDDSDSIQFLHILLTPKLEK